MKKDEIFRLLELNGFSINKVIEKDYGAFVICTRSGIFQSEKVYSLIFYGDYSQSEIVQMREAILSLQLDHADFVIHAICEHSSYKMISSAMPFTISSHISPNSLLDNYDNFDTYKEWICDSFEISKS